MTAQHVPTKSAKMIREGHKIVISGETLTVTQVATTRDEVLGELVVITCGDRVLRRPLNVKIEVRR